MTALDLAVCPICQARYSLARQTTRLEGRTSISYECLECGSVLLWLGDDLWLDADRWSYQEIGRPEMVHLLHETMTSKELRELASRDLGMPGPQAEAAASMRPPSRDWASVSAVGQERAQEVTAKERNEGATAQTVPEAAVERPQTEVAVAAAVPAPTARVRRSAGPTTRQRRSRGSPFLVWSVALVLLCLVCSSAAMIVSSMQNKRGPQDGKATDPVSLSATNVVAETPLVAPTTSPPPVAIETAYPIATETPGVVFQGVTDYVAGSGSHYLVGEVLNRTGENLRFVEILASFYDADGQLVSTGSTFAELGIVEAGGTAPFKLVTLHPPSLVSYKLRADGLPTNVAPLRLDIVSHSARLTEDGRYTINGEVKNPHESTVRFPEIVATYYTATHQVVRVEVAFAELDALQPGGTSPFEVVLVDPPADLHHYALQTEAVVEE